LSRDFWHFDKKSNYKILLSFSYRKASKSKKEVKYMAKNTKGKGWYGDSEGHAKAGRKGGIARGRKSRESKTMDSSIQNN